MRKVTHRSPFGLLIQDPASRLIAAEAVPKVKDGPFQSLSVGFHGRTPAVLEIVDSFGQRSVLKFSQFEANAAVAAELFKFELPKGADLIEQ